LRGVAFPKFACSDGFPEKFSSFLADGEELREGDGVEFRVGKVNLEVGQTEHFGVTEANWREAVKKDPHYANSETPLYAGRAVAALAADPHLMTKSGRVFSSWGLSDEYEFCDADGRRPHWGRYFAEKSGECMKPGDEAFYQYWKGRPLDTIYAEWP